jgi:hypothetical protein
MFFGVGVFGCTATAGLSLRDQPVGIARVGRQYFQARCADLNADGLSSDEQIRQSWA